MNKKTTLTFFKEAYLKITILVDQARENEGG